MLACLGAVFSTLLGKLKCRVNGRNQLTYSCYYTCCCCMKGFNRSNTRSHAKGTRRRDWTQSGKHLSLSIYLSINLSSYISTICVDFILNPHFSNSPLSSFESGFGTPKNWWAMFRIASCIFTATRSKKLWVVIAIIVTAPRPGRALKTSTPSLAAAIFLNSPKTARMRAASTGPRWLRTVG